MKDEEDVESPKPSPTGTPRFTSTGGSRSRQNLTEVFEASNWVFTLLITSIWD